MKPSALQAIFQAEPHESVSRVLEAVGREVAGDCVALFNVATGTPVLFAPATLGAAHLRRAKEAWAAAAAELLSGRIHAERDCTLIPVARPPLALVYVGGVALRPAAADAVLADYGGFFEAAILTADQNRLVYLEHTPLGQIERDKTLLLLQRHHWNYSRVAGLLDITRQALYKRLKRYGVRRPRPAVVPGPE